MDELKYVDGKFTVNGAEVSSADDVAIISANTQQFSIVDNKEFVDLTIDLDDKIIEGTKTNGDKIIGSNLFVNGEITSPTIDYINTNIDKLEEDLIHASSSFKNPEIIPNVVCAGSSITFGDGTFDTSMVRVIDDHLKKNVANFIDCNSMEFNSGTTTFNNNLLYGGYGKIIKGLNSKVEFDIFGDEISICQAKLRTEDYGLMRVLSDGNVIGYFDNKNIINHDREIFTGNSLRRIQLKHPCTYNHVITINNDTVIPDSDISFNRGGYGGSMPPTAKVFIYRGLDKDGEPIHYVEFNTDVFGAINKVDISYDYGRIVSYRKCLVGQLDDGITNESVYGYGSISYDPANPSTGISSGMEFVGIDSSVFYQYKFTTAKKRHIVIEIIGGFNPYFCINFATNRYFNLMNAGIGGWKLSNLLDNNKINDYTQFYKWFMPDIIFNESATNDDWQNGIRRISRPLGKLTLDELSKLSFLETEKVLYDSETDTYDTYSCCGKIDSITYTSLISNNIIGTNTQVGDIVRIGNYHGDNHQVVCRKITSVNLETGEITWDEPISIDQMLNVDDLSDLIGADVNIRNLDNYQKMYKDLIEKCQKISPNPEIIIVAPGLSNYGIRQLWGYDIVHRELCTMYHNVKHCNVTEKIYEFIKNSISGNLYEDVECDGSTSYELNFNRNKYSWQGFKVLVNGIDVYGKNCYIENYYMYFADGTNVGSKLNKEETYANKSNYTHANTRKMKLVFTKNTPQIGDTIKVLFADNTWSGDYCHPNEIGSFIYGQIYKEFIKF